jgi:general secretion pathway protein A
LTNLETADKKLLQIILTGQPELDGRLDSWNLRQLKQRVALRCRLEALDETQAAAYVRLRLQRAGGDPKREVFPEQTLSHIYQYSRGIPRLTNTICENALISGCAQQLRVISPEVITEVATDFRLNASLNEADLVVPTPRAQGLQAFADRLPRVRQ